MIEIALHKNNEFVDIVEIRVEPLVHNQSLLHHLKNEHHAVGNTWWQQLLSYGK